TEQADGEFARAFRALGIDVEALGTEEAAERLRARTIPVELAAALDSWAGVRRHTGKGGAPGWRRLVAVARRAGPAAKRNELREALSRGDRQALVGLAASPQAAGWPASTLVLLGRALLGVGAVEQAVALLRKAQQLYPSDFWVNHHLASSLARLKPPQ